MVLCDMSSHVATSIFTEHKTKILFIILTTFIGLPVIMFMIVAAKGFITQASNARPEDVVAMSITKSSTSISWVTSKNTQGVVEYGTSPTAFVFYGPEVEPKKEHSVPLTLLTPATTYYFRLNIDGTIYDNEGVPWTFTTKTKDGTDVAEAVKGISTTNFSTLEATEEAKVGIVTDNCVYTSCLEIQVHLGTGCNSTDYFKCISAPETTAEGTAITVTPTPSPASVLSAQCSVNYLYSEGCTKWIWEPYLKKSENCTKAFDKYVLQCTDKDPTSTNSEAIPDWRYDYVGKNMSTNSIEITHKMPDGEKIWCEIRVEDEVGGDEHSSKWIIKEALCPSSTPTPTPTLTP